MSQNLTEEFKNYADRFPQKGRVDPNFHASAILNFELKKDVNNGFDMCLKILSVLKLNLNMDEIKVIQIDDERNCLRIGVGGTYTPSVMSVMADNGFFDKIAFVYGVNKITIGENSFEFIKDASQQQQRQLT